VLNPQSEGNQTHFPEDFPSLGTAVSTAESTPHLLGKSSDNAVGNPATLTRTSYQPRRGVKFLLTNKTTDLETVGDQEERCNLPDCLERKLLTDLVTSDSTFSQAGRTSSSPTQSRRAVIARPLTLEEPCHAYAPLH
jgi:hypothetical protein